MTILSPPCALAGFGDFNGDGYTDLAIGVPEEHIGDIAGAGCVNVLYGTANGLSATGSQPDQILWQGESGIDDVPELGDNFGYSLATGDFNFDFYSDLAVGVPGENDNAGAVHVFYGSVTGAVGVPGENDNAGAVHVFYGSVTGLNLAGDQFIRQGFGGLLGTSEPGDQFGWALATGDFNQDYYTDLAIGIPTEDLGKPVKKDAGSVHVIYGTANGLSGANDVILDQDGGMGAPDLAEAHDQFGYSLANGDFNCDGFMDLAVGVAYEDLEYIPSQDDGGAVHVFYGNLSGLIELGAQFWTQESSGTEISEDYDHFGFSLVSGHFNADTYLDLAVGHPYEDLGDGTLKGCGGLPDGGGGKMAGRLEPMPIGDVDKYQAQVYIENAGAVTVLYGSEDGLSDIDAQLWHQNKPGVLNMARKGDLFGYSLTSGFFKSTAFSALAVGVPGDNLENPDLDRAGAVNILYGSNSGLTATGSQLLHQDWGGVEGWAETTDEFGYALTVGWFDGDGYMDLAIGVPYEEVAGLYAAGCVNVLFGSVSGITDVDDEMWHQGSPGVNGSLEEGDGFGAALRGRR
ncbi:MAG: hypothetical protein ACYTG7_16810 [Planctomycetota bacterium]